MPPGVEVEWAGKGADLGEMLEKGEIDALISAFLRLRACYGNTLFSEV